MTRHRGPPSQTWRTFLRNHADAIAAIDLCVAPTLTFGRLLRFWSWVMVDTTSLWFAVTRHPTSEWLAHQIVEAFPWNAAPTHLGATMMAPMDGLHQSRPRRWGFGTARSHRGRRGRNPSGCLPSAAISRCRFDRTIAYVCPAASRIRFAIMSG